MFQLKIYQKKTPFLKTLTSLASHLHHLPITCKYLAGALNSKYLQVILSILSVTYKQCYKGVTSYKYP